MHPQTIKNLSKAPEFKALVAFLAEELHQLNTLDGLSGLSFTERAYEITARLRAKQKLEVILSPLIGGGDNITGANPKDYVV